MRLVQLIHPHFGRKVAVVEEPFLGILKSFSTILEIIHSTFRVKGKLVDIVTMADKTEALNYDAIYSGRSDWQLVPPIDDPGDFQHLLLSGTGLTHRSSALNRNAMHDESGNMQMTDSMKMYQWGEQGGRPRPGEVGVQPEWFYKGNGSQLATHGDMLQIPSFALDGGEEPEIAGIYVVDEDGKPWRIGWVTANEFSDHVMEKQNYLYLAPSKIRNCSIGPELVLDIDFQDISGKVSVIRQGAPCWSADIRTGEKNMCHSLSNLEYHHFKYPSHRIPGQIHVHFFGADAFSFGKGIILEEGDEMEIAWDGMGRPLRNTVTFENTDQKYLEINRL
ncbi:MAG: hypothetical protein KDC80_17555 [Saprospiraceae bacterium]|nr:hypothetical protein [Saprospiraceae bacterium]